MIGEMQSLLDGYWKWLEDQTSLRAVDDWIEITTPYLDDERPVADEVLVAMGAYGVRPVRWSDHDAAREELAA